MVLLLVPETAAWVFSPENSTLRSGSNPTPRSMVSRRLRCSVGYARYPQIALRRPETKWQTTRQSLQAFRCAGFVPDSAALAVQGDWFETSDAVASQGMGAADSGVQGVPAPRCTGRIPTGSRCAGRRCPDGLCHTATACAPRSLGARRRAAKYAVARKPRTVRCPAHRQCARTRTRAATVRETPVNPADLNVQRVELVAAALGKLREKLMLVGGLAANLLVDAPTATVPPVTCAAV